MLARLGLRRRYDNSSQEFKRKRDLVACQIDGDLGLREGDEVKTAVEGQSLRLTPLDQFLALRGALREDESFDTAIEFLEKAWLSWTIPGSA